MFGLVRATRTPHLQSFDSVGQQLAYAAPPATPGAPRPTQTVHYDLDRPPVLATRMDGSTITTTYQSDGKPDTVTTPEGWNSGLAATISRCRLHGLAARRVCAA